MPNLRLKLNFTLVLLAVVFLLIFFHYIKILSPLENLFIRALSPIQAKIYSLTLKINNSLLFSKTSADLQKENQALQEQVEQLILDNANLRLQSDKMKILEEQLKLVASFKQNFISCQVISKQYLNSSDTLVINCGSNQGIKEGLPAIASRGVIIGKITEVKPNLSSILLLSSQGSKIGATILNQQKTMGIISGGDDSNLKMDFIPKDASLKTGDIVVTSKLEANIPAELVIGQIETISVQANSFFKQAGIKPIIDYGNVTLVSILLPPAL